MSSLTISNDTKRQPPNITRVIKFNLVEINNSEVIFSCENSSNIPNMSTEIRFSVSDVKKIISQFETPHTN